MMLQKAKNYILLRGLRAYLNVLSYLSSRRAGTLALDLFSTPRAGRNFGRNEVFLQEAQQQDLAIEGLNIRTYHWSGTGQRILLVHGWESNTARWKELVHTLRQKNADIIAVDAPAHGQSSGRYFTVLLYAKILKQVVEHYRPTAMVGHSAGGMATVVCTAQYQPASLEKLVILGTPSELTGLVEIYRQYLNLSPRVIVSMDQIFHQRYDRSISNFSIADFATQLRLPGLILHDIEDHIAPVAEAKSIHKHWEDAQLVITEGLGHSLQGSFVVDQVTNFLYASISARSSSSLTNS